MALEPSPEIARQLTAQEQIDYPARAALVAEVITKAEVIVGQPSVAIDEAGAKASADAINDAVDAAWAQVELNRTPEERECAAIDLFKSTVAWKIAQAQALGPEWIYDTHDAGTTRIGAELYSGGSENQKFGSSLIQISQFNAKCGARFVYSPLDRSRSAAPETASAIKEQYPGTLGSTDMSKWVVHEESVDVVSPNPDGSKVKPYRSYEIAIGAPTEADIDKIHFTFPHLDIKDFQQLTQLIGSAKPHLPMPEVNDTRDTDLDDSDEESIRTRDGTVVACPVLVAGKNGESQIFLQEVS